MITASTQAVVKRFEDAKSHGERWLGRWRDQVKYAMPSEQNIGIDSQTTVPSADLIADLYDGTAMSANIIYGAGCMSWLTPEQRPWFKFEPPRRLKDSEPVKRWVSEVTEKTIQLLGESNFYGEIHRCYLDDGAIGTESLFAEWDPKIGLYFDRWCPGSYWILQDKRNQVDSVFREYRQTVRQMEQEFGLENLPASLQAKMASGDGSQQDSKETIMHAIYPREDAERDFFKMDGANMPIASVYIHMGTKEEIDSELSVEGYWEMPVAVARHLPFSDSPLGMSPAYMALADAKQLNDQQASLDVHGEVSVHPPILAKAGHEGNIDRRKNGLTYYADKDSKPETWGPDQQGIPHQMERVKNRQDAVKKAFFVDLFQMIANLPVDQDFTAFEIQQRIMDRLTGFTPTFSRKKKELIQPTLTRTFALAMRNGQYSEPPEELLVEDQEGSGVVYYDTPELTLTGRLALLIDQIQNDGMDRLFADIAPVAGIMPEVLDNFDFDAGSRLKARHYNVPEEVIVPVATRDQKRQRRAAAAQADLERQDAEQEAGIVTEAAKAGLVEAQ